LHAEEATFGAYFATICTFLLLITPVRPASKPQAKCTSTAGYSLRLLYAYGLNPST